MRVAQANLTRGSTGLQGALENLGHELERNTIKRSIAEHGIAPALGVGQERCWNVSKNLRHSRTTFSDPPDYGGETREVGARTTSASMARSEEREAEKGRIGQVRTEACESSGLVQHPVRIVVSGRRVDPALSDAQTEASSSFRDRKLSGRNR